MNVGLHSIDHAGNLAVKLFPSALCVLSTLSLFALYCLLWCVVMLLCFVRMGAKKKKP